MDVYENILYMSNIEAYPCDGECPFCVSFSY